MLEAGFTSIAPEIKSAAKLMVLMETKAGRKRVKDFLRDAYEVQASSTSELDSGGTAVVAPHN
jgi:hypothetical protein